MDLRGRRSVDGKPKTDAPPHKTTRIEREKLQNEAGEAGQNQFQEEKVIAELFANSLLRVVV